jgi:hypothetical protein
MKRTVLIAATALIALSSGAFGQGSGAFGKGSMEFGGNFLFSRVTEYGVFDQNATTEERGGYFDTIQAGVNLGAFPIDGLSLVLSPSIFMFRRHSLNEVPIAGMLESYSGDMIITFDLGSRCYIPTKSAFAFSLGADLGFGTTFGLKKMVDDVAVDNKHTYIQLSFEPRAAAYYFISPRAAPYAELGYKLAFYKKTKNDDGSSYDPGSGWSMWEDVLGRLDATLGLKFFMPAPGRFGDVARRDFDDLMDDGLMK